MSQSPFSKGETPPHWWNGYQLSHDWLLDLRQRLQWLYGDMNERLAAGAADREAWHRLGRRGAP